MDGARKVRLPESSSTKGSMSVLMLDKNISFLLT